MKIISSKCTYRCVEIENRLDLFLSNNHLILVVSFSNIRMRNSTLSQVERVPIPWRNHLEWIEKGVRCVSRPTIWSRAYYSPLIQSHEPWLNKSASFPRESPPLHLSFFPFHGFCPPPPSLPQSLTFLTIIPAECARFNSKWLPRMEVAFGDILRTFEEVDRTPLPSIA